MIPNERGPTKDQGKEIKLRRRMKSLEICRHTSDLCTQA